MSSVAWKRLIRFISHSSDTPLVGEPVKLDQDVGLATYNGEDVEVEVYSGVSVLTAGKPTGKRVMVRRLLSPLSQKEVGTIRGIGLNYVSHANEMQMQIPNIPTIFSKPSHALNNPFPSTITIPRHIVSDNAADYEAELALVIGKDAKDVPEDKALDYLLGFTACHDVSERKAQFAQTQWTYSKSFDGFCPIGPVLVHRDQAESWQSITLTGALDGQVVQNSRLNDLIFSVPRIITFLSQGTTLPAGTLIMTGTPAGVGWSKAPPLRLKDGSEFRVFISHGVGTLINKVEEEK